MESRTRRLGACEPLSLDDPSLVWTVESGRVAVFAVEHRRDGGRGARRHLFDCGHGEHLFGLATAEGRDASLALQAIALGRTVVRGVPLQDLSNPGEALSCWVEHWRTRLRDLPAQAWEDDAGNAPPDVRQLADFHDAVRERLARRLEEDARWERGRLSERDRLTREAAHHAVDELAAVLQPTGSQPLPRGSTLYMAACAVTRELGMTLQAPPAWQVVDAYTDPVEQIARASRLRIRRVLLEGDWWLQDGGPLLAYRGRGRQPVALLPRGANRYWVFDPDTGAREPVDEACAATLAPEAWVFYRPLPERALQGVDLLRFALRGRGPDLMTIMLCGVGATLLGMLTPQATALLVDHAVPDGDMTMLWQLALGLAAAACGAALFRLAQGIAATRFETGADVTTQTAVWDRLLRLQPSFFRVFSTGDLQSRVSAVGQMRAYLGGATLRSLFASFIALLNLILLLYYSPLLSLVALGAATIGAALTIVSGYLILQCTRRILELQGTFFGFVVQLVQGVAKLRVAAAEERAFARWAMRYSELSRLQLRERRLQDGVQVLNIAVTTASTIALFALASALLAMQSGLTTGVFLAFNVAFGTFIGAVAGLSNTVTDVMAVAILRERARPILEASPEVGESKADPGRLSGRIDIRGVSFRYGEDAPVILDRVSLRVQPGEFVALVGPSGSGKSTLLRLLLAFENPMSGSIHFDGQDLASIDVHAVRRQMGVVMQHGRIAAGSIFDNIVSGTHRSLNEAWAAARAAGLASEIEQMPMGMHTVISEGGTNLSGGQRQRLLLARALVHKPSILLLDEATSALDNETQAVVSQSLRELEVTRIVIAHRLSTVRDADRIYVIESGSVAEQGTFDELLAAGGLFSGLMSRQQGDIPA